MLAFAATRVFEHGNLAGSAATVVVVVAVGSAMHLGRNAPGDALSLLGAGVDGVGTTTTILSAPGGIASLGPVALIGGVQGWASHATFSTVVS
jgi:hypothetical protein